MTNKIERVIKILKEFIKKSDFKIRNDLATKLFDENKVERLEFVKIWSGTIALEDLSDVIICILYSSFKTVAPQIFNIPTEELFDEDTINKASEYSYEKKSRHEGLYNPIVKNMYLNTIDSEDKKYSVKQKLKSVGEKLESVLAKDLAEMSIEEVVQYFPMVNQMEYSSIRSLLSVFSNYIRWAQDNKLFPETNQSLASIDKYGINIKSALKNNIFKSYEDLIYAVETVYDLDNCINAEGVVVTLAWLGLDINEIAGLRYDQVDLENGIIHLPNKQVEMSDVMVSVLKRYNKGEGIRASGTVNERVVFLDNSSEMFVRYAITPNMTPRGEAHSMKKQLTVRMIRLTNRYNEITDGVKIISMSNINLSGQLYRLYSKELKNGELLDSDFTEEYVVLKRHFEKRKKGVNTYSLLLKDKRIQYQEYKKVFWGIENPPA